MSYFKELQELEDQGIDLIEVLGQDRHLDSPEALQRIISQLARAGDNLYSELLYFLTYRRFSAEKAEALWGAIMKHKARMSEALGHRVTFRVAALDYLSVRNLILRQVRLIAKPEFESIFSYVNIDEVTSVFNRRYFNEVLAQEVHRSRRYKSPLSLLILDIDDFKRVNDSLGHVEGDSALRKVGRMLRDSTRLTDYVCRFGGDEFAVILPQTGCADAYTLAERIRKQRVRFGATSGNDAGDSWKTEAPAGLARDLLGGVSPGGGGAAPDTASLPKDLLTVSIGGATFPEECEETEELVALADQMCLDAKRKGKDRVLMGGGGHGLPLKG